MLAKIIAIEGPDKSGKMTQTRMLTASLRKKGNKVALVEVPVKDSLTYSLIYKMLANGTAKSWPNVFQTLQFLNKLIFQLTQLLWLRLTNDFIVFDRWSLSALVYGDAGGSSSFLNNVYYWLLTRPAVTIVLRGATFKRSSEADDTYEKDAALQLLVRLGYHDWARNNPEDHVVVDNRAEKEEVHKRIMRALVRML